MNQFVTNIILPKDFSPLMQTRHRLASCNNQNKPRQHYLHMVTNASNYRIKANSLPSILDSESSNDIIDEKEGLNKSPVSTASYEKKRTRNKPWRYLQRQRTSEEMTPLDMEEGKSMIIKQPKNEQYEDRNGFKRVGNFIYFYCLSLNILITHIIL